MTALTTNDLASALSTDDAIQLVNDIATRHAWVYVVYDEHDAWEAVDRACQSRFGHDHTSTDKVDALAVALMKSDVWRESLAAYLNERAWDYLLDAALNIVDGSNG